MEKIQFRIEIPAKSGHKKTVIRKDHGLHPKAKNSV